MVISMKIKNKVVVKTNKQIKAEKEMAYKEGFDIGCGMGYGLFAVTAGVVGLTDIVTRSINRVCHKRRTKKFETEVEKIYNNAQ